MEMVLLIERDLDDDNDGILDTLEGFSLAFLQEKFMGWCDWSHGFKSHIHSQGWLNLYIGLNLL